MELMVWVLVFVGGYAGVLAWLLVRARRGGGTQRDAEGGGGAE